MPSLAGVAIRNIVRSPRRSVLVSLAVMGGCTALVFMLSMNNGLAEMMVTNSVGLMLGHVQVDATDGGPTVATEPALGIALGTAGVRAAAPRLDLPVLLGREGAVHGGLLMGMDAVREREASTFPALVIQGKLPEPGDGRVVLLGSALAEALGVRVGDLVRVSFQDWLNEMTSAKLRVTGIFRAGSEELDQRLALAPLGEVRRLLDVSDQPVSRIVVRAKTNALAPVVAAELRARLDPAVYRVRTWDQVSPLLKAMVIFQHGSANVVLFFLYLVVGAGVAAIQLMSILERTRELGVLASIGFSPRRIVALLATETAFLGSVAVGLGLGLGVAIVSAVARGGGIDVRIAGGANLEGLLGMDPHLIPVISNRVVLYTAGLVAPVLLLGGLLPALRATRMTPMEALRRG
jgi:putative ABC transport system permease protein